MGRAAMKVETTKTQWELREWAKWHRKKFTGAKGYPNQTPFRRLLGGSIPEPQIEDERVERIDEAVCVLMRRNQLQGTVLVLYYVEELIVYNVACRLALSQERAGRVLAQAETAIEYILESIDNSGVKL
jgi:hypothetical protein